MVWRIICTVFRGMLGGRILCTAALGMGDGD